MRAELAYVPPGQKDVQGAIKYTQIHTRSGQINLIIVMSGDAIGGY